MASKKINYDIKIGALKSLKNNAITYGLPALLYLLNNYQEWLPKDKALQLAPVVGFISYMVHNYLKVNKN